MRLADQLRRNSMAQGENQELVFVAQQVVEHGSQDLRLARLRAQLVGPETRQREELAEAPDVLGEEAQGLQRDCFSLISNHSLKPLKFIENGRSSSGRGSSLTVGYALERKLAAGHLCENRCKRGPGSQAEP